MKNINKAPFYDFPNIKSPRLLLRKLELKDAEQIYEMRSNNRVNQFISRPNMNDKDSAIQLVEKTLLAYQNQQGIAWAGVLRDSKTIIGTCGFNSIDYNNLRAEIGGEMSVDFWGKKLALEAVELIVKFGFETLQLHSIEAKVSPENRGAISILESIGFIKEAHYKERIFFKGEFSDMAVYSVLSEALNS